MDMIEQISWRIRDGTRAHLGTTQKSVFIMTATGLYLNQLVDQER